MKRYGSVIGLRQDRIEEYKRLHAAVWPDVLAQIRRSNIRNYSIYLRAMAADAATRRWWALMEPMQEKWPTATPDEWWSDMIEVFHAD